MHLKADTRENTEHATTRPTHLSVSPDTPTRHRRRNSIIEIDRAAKT